MATMNIKDPRVRELAMELARLRGTSATAAVREALEDALANERRSRADFRSALAGIQARVAACPDPILADEDLYDENGLPR